MMPVTRSRGDTTARKHVETNVPTLWDAAVAAARRGWRVFPVRPGDKRPAFPNHAAGTCDRTDPWCRGGHTGWEHRATTDTDRIAAAWSRQPYNIGIAAGPSGLLVIDLDAVKHEERPGPGGILDGHDALADLCERHRQPFPFDTYAVATPSGGTHLYFRHPADGPPLRNTAGALARMIDTRGHGGYVVAAGSAVDAGSYQLLNDAEPAPLPEWLAGLLIEQQTPASPSAHPRPSGNPGDRRLAPLLRTVLEAREGQRNSRLYWAATRLFRHARAGQVDAGAGRDALIDAATYVGLPAAEARATVASAYRHEIGAA